MIKSLLARLLIELVFVHVLGGFVFCIDKLMPNGWPHMINTIPHFYAYAILCRLIADDLHYLLDNK